MNIFVSIFCIEEGVLDDLVGPFESPELAKAWVDSDIQAESGNYPSYKVDESADGELTMFGDEDETDPHGFVYQVITASAPVEVVADGD